LVKALGRPALLKGKKGDYFHGLSVLWAQFRFPYAPLATLRRVVRVA
jgi:hypothetical protein